MPQQKGLPALKDIPDEIKKHPYFQTWYRKQQENQKKAEQDSLDIEYKKAQIAATKALTEQRQKEPELPKPLTPKQLYEQSVYERLRKGEGVSRADSSLVFPGYGLAEREKEEKIEGYYNIGRDKKGNPLLDGEKITEEQYKFYKAFNKRQEKRLGLEPEFKGPYSPEHYKKPTPREQVDFTGKKVEGNVPEGLIFRDNVTRKVYKVINGVAVDITDEYPKK